jgi:hypothetical protein
MADDETPTTDEPSDDNVDTEGMGPALGDDDPVESEAGED